METFRNSASRQGMSAEKQEGKKNAKEQTAGCMRVDV